MANADVEIRLRLINEASQGVKKAEQDAQKGAEKTATATERAAAKAATAAERGAAQQRSAYKRTAQAREQLGIRSERTIQREIDRTVAAYNRLARSGTASWREQGRAAEQMRQRVTQLTNEMGKLTAAQKAVGAFKAGASVAAGTVAAGAVLKAPVLKGMAFDEQLAHIANDAFQERDKLGRIQGKEQLREAINSAQRTSGGTQDSLAETMNSLISSGEMSIDEASKMLPVLAKAATASGTDIDKLTELALTAMRTYSVKAEEIPNILNQTLAAGHAGGFKLNRLVDFLPTQMARAAESGMSGRADYAALAALNQSALRTSGNQEEAGRSVQTILSLLNDKSVAEQVKRTTGVNLPKYLASQKDKGVSSIDAFTGLLQKSVEKNSSYKALQAKLASAKNDEERTATLEGMAAIAQRSSLGSMVPNRRAMMALLAMMNEQSYMQDVRRQIMENDVATGGVLDKDFEVISEESGFKTRQAGEVASITQQTALRGLNEKIGETADGFSKLAGEYPALVGGMVAATTALTAFAGAAGLASLAMGGRAIAGRALGGIGGRVAAGAGIRSLASRASAGSAVRGIGAGAMSIGKGALKAVGKGGVLAVGTMAGEYALEKTFGEDSAVARYGSAALNGAAIGATVGSIIPGVGTAIGAAAGGAIGLIAQGLSDWFSSDDAPKAEAQQEPAEINAQFQIGLAPGLVLQSQSMQTSGGNIRMNTGNLMTGAP